MIKNGLFTASILTSAAMAACFSGCSTGSGGSNTGGTTGSSGGSGFSSSSSGAGNETGSSSGSSSGAGGMDAGPCMPPASIQSNELPPYAPVMGMANACNSMQIQNFVSSCVSTGATGNTCASWASSNQTCANCIVQQTDAGATESGAILFNTMGRPVSGNVPGCIAIADPTNGPACAEQLEPVFQCVALACSTCMDQSSFTAGEAAAKSSNGACGGFVTAAQDPCAMALADGGVGVSACGYGTPNELTDVLNVICGAGP